MLHNLHISAANYLRHYTLCYIHYAHYTVTMHLNINNGRNTLILVLGHNNIQHNRTSCLDAI